MKLTILTILLFCTLTASADVWRNAVLRNATLGVAAEAPPVVYTCDLGISQTSDNDYWESGILSQAIKIPAATNVCRLEVSVSGLAAGARGAYWVFADNRYGSNRFGWPSSYAQYQGAGTGTISADWDPPMQLTGDCWLVRVSTSAALRWRSSTANPYEGTNYFLYAGSSGNKLTSDYVFGLYGTEEPAPASVTNNFEFLAAWPTGADGDRVTDQVVRTNTRSFQPLHGIAYGTRSATADPTNTYFLSSAASYPLGTYTLGNDTITDTTTLGLRMNHGQAATADLVWKFDDLPDHLCLGYYYKASFTNSYPTNIDQFLYHEMASAGNVSTPVFVADNPPFFYAHGSSNGVTVTGNYVYGVETNTWYWVTERLSGSNTIVAFYDPTTWSQVSTNSTCTNGTRSDFAMMRFVAHSTCGGQPGANSYFDSLVVTTNDVFPLLPSTLPTNIR